MRRRIGGALVVGALVWSTFPSLLVARADTSLPGAPIGVGAQAGTLSATVTWTPADASAGSFTVRSTPGGITTTVDGSSASATVTGLGFGLRYTFTVAGNNSLGTGPASAPSNPVTPDAPGGPYHQGVARVLLDSDLAAGAPVRFDVGADRVHAPGLQAVALNITVRQASQASAIQITERDQVIQSIPVAPGTVQSSLAVIPAPDELTQAAIQVGSGTAHVEVDFEGFFTDPRTVRDHSGMFQAVDTAALLDDSIDAGGSIDIPISGQGDVPSSGVGGVLLNVTAINPTGDGSFTILPHGVTPNGTTTLGFVAGQTTSNRVFVPLPGSGDVTLFDAGAGAGVHIDLLGWFTDGSDKTAQAALFTPLSPTRLVDAVPLASGGSLKVQVWDQGGAPGASAPAPATSAVFEISSQSAGAGSIAIGGTSIVDYAAGQAVAGVDVVRLASDGSASLSAVGAAAIVTVDLIGFMSGDLIIPGSTKVLTAAQLAAITNVGADMTITFAPGAQISPPIRLDDVIAAGLSPATPRGFLRRVLGISTLADGSTLLVTRHASILEALTTFTIEWVMPRIPGFAMSTGRVHAQLASPLQSTSPFPPPNGTSIDPQFLSFAIVKPPARLFIDLASVGLGGSELDLNDLEIQALPNLKISGNPFGAIHIAVGFSVAARAQLVLSLVAKALGIQNRLIWELPGGIHIFGPVPVGTLGPIPIFLDLNADIQVNLTLALDGGFAINYNVDRYGAVSGGFNGSSFFADQPVYKDYLTPQQAVSIHPDVQAQAELDVHVIPKIDIDDGVGAIGVDVRPFVRGVVDPLASPWWFVSAGVCAALTIGLDIFIHKFFAFPAACIELEILHAPAAKPVITITPASPTVARSGTQHFHASVTNSQFGVVWTVKEPRGGTLSNVTQLDVDYSAPLTAGTYHLHAEAVEDRTSAVDIPITVPPVAPSPPTSVVAALTTSTSAIIGWTAPADDGGAPLTTYQVTVSPSGALIGINAPQTTALVNNLNPGTTYLFTVTATNKANLTSASSTVSNPITTPPAGPMSVAPTTINFGSVTLGQSSQPQTVVVTAGGNPLAISTISIGGANPGEFSIPNQTDTCSGQTLQSGAACSFAILYVPTQQIQASALVSITDSDATSPQTVTLTGSSPVPAVSAVVSFFDMQMVDSQTGYALAASFGSEIFKTTDGGKTWNRLVLPAFVQLNNAAGGYNLRFLDANHGFVSAYRQLQPAGRVGVILATSDGGQTWQQISVPTGVGVGSIWFTDMSHGWFLSGVAGPPPPPGSIVSSVLLAVYATSDGGVTWTRQSFADPIIDGTSGCIGLEGNVSLRFTDALDGWMSSAVLCRAPNGSITAQGAVFWSTNDGGTTWVAHQAPAGIFNVFGRIQVTGPSQIRQLGVVQVNSTTSQKVLVTSDDGGANFTAAPLPALNQAAQVQALTFSDSTHGSFVTSDGHVMRTSDTGATWQDTALPRFASSAGRITSYGYEAIDSPDGTHIWVVGGVLYGNIAQGGFIEGSADSGATWTVQLLGSGS